MSNIQILDLHIHRMPGLKDLKKLSEVSPQINIITGRNGAGKSSTARAIQKLIWRQDIEGISLEGTFKTDDDNWAVHIDHGSVKMQRNGEDSFLTDLPPTSDIKRYMLSLPDLIQAEEKDLASEILRASRGGYDLDAAIDKLSYPSFKRSANTPAFKNYNQSNGSYHKELENQKKLKVKESHLEGLRKNRDSASLAANDRDWYKKIVEYREQLTKLNDATEQLRGFPPKLKDLKGNEANTLADFEKRITKTRENIVSLDGKIAEYEKIKLDTNLPDEGCPTNILEELKNRSETLIELERKKSDAMASLSQSTGRKIDVLRQLGIENDFDNWHGLTPQEIGLLDANYQGTLDIRNKIHQCETEIEQNEKEQNSLQKVAKSDVTGLIQGIRILTQWLRTQERSSGLSFWLAFLTGLAGVFVAGIAWRFREFGIYGIIGISIIWVYFLIRYLVQKRDSQRSGLEAAYKGLSLQEPGAWTVEEVARHITDLIEQLQVTIQKQKFQEKHQELTSQLIKDRAAFSDKMNELERLWKDIGLLPNLDPSRLYWHIKSMHEWHCAHIEEVGLAAKVKDLAEQHNQVVAACSDLVGIFINSKMPTDASGFKALYGRLREGEDVRRRAVEVVEESKTQRTGLISEMDNILSDLSNLFERLGLTPEDRYEWDVLLAQESAYKDAQRSFEHEETATKLIMGQLKVLRQFDQFDVDKELSKERLEELISECDQLASKYEGLIVEITTVENEINAKKSNDDLEKIMTDREKYLEDLEEDYLEGLSSITGHLINLQLKEVSGSQHRPQVLKKAEELFSTITSGEYTLHVSGKESPEFRAKKSDDPITRELEELSTGTRIQLLMSVRLAFVECQEGKYKLPLLADELMATSDNFRSLQIVHSLVNISRTGRQVFYFTAEADEVAKWKNFLSKQPDFDYKVFDIERDTEDQDSLNLEYASMSFGTEELVPSPEGLSHTEYKHKIRVPLFDLLQDNAKHLHLWYLTNDLNFLYKCLKNGIQTYGQLITFLSAMHSGEAEAFGGDTYEMDWKFKLLEKYQELFMEGRSKPIEANELTNAGVTNSFLALVMERLKLVNGDAGSLINSLKENPILRLRTNTIEGMHTYFIENGHISTDSKLSTEDIRLRLTAHMYTNRIALMDGELFLNLVKEMPREGKDNFS